MRAGIFRPGEVVAAVGAAAGVQLLLFWAFASARAAPVRANLSDENSRLIAVAITPVSSLPSDPHRKRGLPRAWRRTHEVPLVKNTTQLARANRPAEPEPPDGGPRDTSPVSEDDPDGDRRITTAGTIASPDAGARDDDDGLKQRAIDIYRGDLVAWFLARFDIRGKLAFATLKHLRAVASISITPEHTVDSFTLTAESGNPIFDAQVKSALAIIRSSGASLPPPPPLYPDLLGKSLSVSFQCTVRSACE
ncbi:MAG: TonB C-terminal domain-containing protein [Polyangia bacterium]